MWTGSPRAHEVTKEKRSAGNGAPVTTGRVDAAKCSGTGPRPRRAATYPELPLTDHQLDAVVATAEYLLGLNLPPLFRLDVLRALWRRECDRELACELARLRGVA